jgi:hypothetical protein
VCQRLERDPPVRRQLPAGDAQHPGWAACEQRLATGGRCRAVAAGQDAETGERRANADAGERLDVDGDRRLGEHLLDVGVVDGDRRGVAFEQRVRRSQQQHPLPRHREAHAHAIVRDRQRGRPGRAWLEDDVDALAEPDRRAGARILQPADGVDPRAGGVDDGASADLDVLAVGRDLSDLVAQSHKLGAVQNGRARLGRRSDVRQAEPAVVRPRVRVEPARSETVRPQRRNHALRPRDIDESVEPRPGERLVDGDPRLHHERPVGPVPVQRKQERQPAHEMRRDDGHERAPFVVSLANEADVAEPQVAQAAVDELRRGAGSRAAEVAAVDERHGEPDA